MGIAETNEELVWIYETSHCDEEIDLPSFFDKHGIPMSEVDVSRLRIKVDCFIGGQYTYGDEMTVEIRYKKTPS